MIGKKAPNPKQIPLEFYTLQSNKNNDLKIRNIERCVPLCILLSYLSTTVQAYLLSLSIDMK